MQADFDVFSGRNIKEKIFSKKFAVVKNKFLSLQPRFFEKIFLEAVFLLLQPFFKIKILLIKKKDYLQSLAIGVNFVIRKY